MALIPSGQAIYNIINVGTTYSGGWYPNNKAINEISATSKFMVYTGKELINYTHYYKQSFLLVVRSTSTTALTTMLITIMKEGSNYHGGFIPNGTHIVSNGYPYFLAFPEGNKSEFKEIGPNEFEAQLELIASFEVT